MKHLIVFVLFGIICIYSKAQNNFEGNVVEVIDGNTMRVIDNYNDTITIKLKSFDSPELNQAFGEEARAFTADKCLHKKAKIELLGKDRFGNDMATVTSEDNEDLGMALLKSGLAWYNVKGTADETLENIQNTNITNNVGLWAQENPLEPWIYRRQQTMTKPKLSY